MYSHEHWWRGKQQNGGSNARRSSPVGVRLLQLRVAGESHTPCYWDWGWRMVRSKDDWRLKVVEDNKTCSWPWFENLFLADFPIIITIKTKKSWRFFVYWSMNLKLFVVYLYTIWQLWSKKNCKIKKQSFLGHSMNHSSWRTPWIK